MSINDEMSDKKRALLAYKNKLLNDLHYCGKRIEEMGKKQTQSYYDDEDSSDSDAGLTQPVKLGPTSHQLRAETSQLNLCLQATQELTSLEVLESEVNVLVDPPKLKDGIFPKKDGVWKEALAECKVDLIPYCITFYIFQPSKRFGSPSYHQLRVTPTKSGHEKELANSILKNLTRPSDAWQVLKSYSAASRSRRSTMARLCDKFGDAIVVGAAENGGFTIKCATVLEISWSLHNIWSPVMPFQHKMKFDLEYMDEHYLKAIKHAHKQLSDPSLETDERTEILTNILNICIEAAGNIASESETDQSVHLTPVKRCTTLEEEPEIPVKKRTLNSGAESVMPPPKGVPKKVKTKDKENVNLNRNGLERESHVSKSKGSIRDNLNKNAKTKDDLNRDSLKSIDKGVSKDKVSDHIKDDGKLKNKEIARETTDSNNLKRMREHTVATNSKADKQGKESETTSKINNANKQKKNSQVNEIHAKDGNVAEKTNKNHKKSRDNHQIENKNREKPNENSQKSHENRQKVSESHQNEKRPKVNHDCPTSSDNRQKPTDNKTQKIKNDANENRQKLKDQRQKQSEIQKKLNENRQRTNEKARKPNENDKQNDKGKNDTEKREKLKTSSKIPKLFPKDKFKQQSSISKQISGKIEKYTNDKVKKYDHFEKKVSKNDFNTNQNDKKNVIVKKNDKQNDKFGIKTDKYRLVSKSKILPSGNTRKQ